MRNFLTVCAGVAACAAIANADIKHAVAEKGATALRNDQVRDGTHLIREIQNLVTGEKIYPNGGPDTRVNQPVLDNLTANTAVWGGTVGRLNVESVDPNTFEALCTDNLPLTASYLRFAIETGFTACTDPNETGEEADTVGGFCSNQLTGDAWADDYFLDAAAGDPNQMTTINAHSFLWTYSPDRPLRPGDDDRHRFRYLLDDAYDRDGTGRFEITGGYSITVDWDPNGVQVGQFIYTFNVDLSGLSGGGIDGFNVGWFVMDIDNNTYDSIGNPVPGNYACGTLFEWARGYRNIPGFNFPGCLPGQMYAVGGEAEPNNWVQFNVFNGPFIPDPNDPNQSICGPIDASADGDPNTLTYEDVLTSGLIINVTYTGGGVTGGTVVLSPNLMGTLTADINVANCPGDCNGDNTVNVDDLLAVLGNFGTAGPLGDCDNDGDVDVDDLLGVLGNFGNTCP